MVTHRLPVCQPVNRRCLLAFAGYAGHSATMTSIHVSFCHEVFVSDLIWIHFPMSFVVISHWESDDRGVCYRSFKWFLQKYNRRKVFLSRGLYFQQTVTVFYRLYWNIWPPGSFPVIKGFTHFPLLKSNFSQLLLIRSQLWIAFLFVIITRRLSWSLDSWVWCFGCNCFITSTDAIASVHALSLVLLPIYTCVINLEFLSLPSCRPGKPNVC